VASLVCFLLPLLFAVGGAVLCRFSPTAELLGAMAGLTAGMFLWRIAARLLTISREGA
jgi:hypothetical protein